VTAKAQEDSDWILGGLRAFSRDVVVDQAATARSIAAMSFLIARKDVARFRRAADGISQDLAPRVRLRVRGPLPPFSFATLPGQAASTPTEAGTAWA
jgi:hypothetical protein